MQQPGEPFVCEDCGESNIDADGLHSCRWTGRRYDQLSRLGHQLRHGRELRLDSELLCIGDRLHNLARQANDRGDGENGQRLRALADTVFALRKDVRRNQRP